MSRKRRNLHSIPFEREVRRIAKENRISLSAAIKEAVSDYIQKEKFIASEINMILLAESEKT